MRSFVCAIALVLLACAQSSRPAIPVAQCTYASDCGATQICSAAGRCVPQCAADRDCATGQTCTAGACVLPSGHCLRNTDCATGQACGANGLCGATCASSQQCGAGFICLANTCLAQQPECVKDADCGAGRVCTTSNTCAQSCTAPSQCPTAQTCSAGACVPAQPQCATSTDCTAPQICREARCVAQCAADQDCNAGQRCQSGVCQQLPAQCAYNSDCPLGKSCVSGTCSNACIASRDCPAGDVCNLGLCVLPAPQCAVAADCASGQACSPAGQCVASCSPSIPCTSGICSNGACVSNGPDTATVGGSAVYAGQTNNAGIMVKLSGPGFAQAVTDATGAYSFAGLPPGLYTVTFTAAYSAEGTFTTQASAKAGVTTTVPTVSFSPRGEVKGTVVLQGQSSALGVSVFVSGSSRGATADASGNFDITGVPVGSQQIIASYPGFNAASTTVAVAAGAVTTLTSPLTLTPQVVSNSGVFAFQSTPPLTVLQNHAYAYTAVAAGAGITGVTYAIAAGPPGMTINVTSGAVSFTPTYLTSFTVAIAATGGGSIVYQVFNLRVLSQLQQQLPTPDAVRDGDADGGVTWVLGSNSLTRFANSTAVGFDAGGPQFSAKTTSVTVANTGNITGYSAPGGTVTSLGSSTGTVGATWPGGIIPDGGVAIASSYAIASAALEGGTVKSVVVQGAVNATGINYPSGTASSISANKLVPTSVGVSDAMTTGVVTGVTATVLTDSTRGATTPAWTTAIAGKCVTNQGTTNYLVIASTPAPTATTLTITSGDLTTILGVNERYFIVPCYGYLNYQMTFAPGTMNFSTTPGFDMYLSGVFLNLYTNTFAGAVDSFTFNAPVGDYAALVQLPASGFVLAAQTGSYHLLTYVDSTVTGATTGKIGFPGLQGTFVVDASSAVGKIVAQVPLGTNILPLLSRFNYVLADATGQVHVTLNATGLTVSAGQYVWNDSIGTGYPVLTASPVVLGLPPQDLMRPWAGALVAPTAAPTSSSTVKTPTIVVTDQQGGFTPGVFVGKRFVSRLPAIQPGVISANDATTVTWASDDCYIYSNCSGRVQSLLSSSFAGSGWAAQSSTTGKLRVDLTAQTAWSPVDDSLVGRVVVPKSNPGYQGTLVVNKATLAVAEVSGFSAADAFTSLAAGQLVYLADGALQYSSPTISVSITPDLSPGWPVNGYVGYLLITSDGSTVGTVTANTATTVTVSATLGYLSALVGGRAFAFGSAGNGAPCYGAGQVSATVTLTSPNFISGTYDYLTAGYFSSSVVSNGSNSVAVPLCAYQFASLVSAIGSTGVLSSKGSIPVVLTDASAAFTPGALKGYSVRPKSNPTFSGFPAVLDNGVQTINFSLPSYSSSQLASLSAGTSYLLVDPAGYVQLRVTTDAALTPGALVGAFVHALAVNPYYTTPFDLPMLVTANDASSITTSATTNGYLGEYESFVGSKFQKLQFSAGSVLNLTDTTASFTPNALAGQTVQFAGRSLLVASNTAQTIVAASSDSLLAVAPPTAGAQYVVPSLLAGGSRVRAQSDGTALVGLGNVATYPYPAANGTQAAIAKVGASGVTALYTPFSTGKQVQVTSRTTLRGTYTSATNQGLFVQIADTAASWTPNALAGAAFSGRLPYGGWFTYTVMGNTATTLQLYVGNSSFQPDATQIYVIDTLRLDVAGGGLTAHAYAGAQLWLQGSTWQVRDNDAGSLLLHRAVAPPGIASVGPGGATGWLLTGLRGNRVNGIAPNGAGFVAATDDGITFFDGANWTHEGVRETSQQLGTGSISDFTSSSVTCTACNFTASAFAGGQLLLSDGPHSIQGNSAHVISLSQPIQVQYPPLLGDSFVVLDGRGLNRESTDVAVDGSTIWVTSAAGLLKGVSGSWSLLTSADGLPAATLTGAAVRVPGELWVTTSAAGVARLVSGSPPQQFTAAGTETAPGKGDGLPGDTIFRISFDGAKTWFAGTGAASFDPTATRPWTPVPYSLIGSVYVVVIPSAGIDWFGTASGLFSVLP